ncbi:uncharacterized protein LOC133150985 isoform X1 [Syngnathus typhle]|uniref:uncharacterized protein LOC133150985 isoform X1 n=1 Tax=Syngnathus typhle TaxID=161592 RepID=UPI002A6A8578|nr:uncharacterized protein LOC133150985 isoform X1 [Syngnathus typhle]
MCTLHTDHTRVGDTLPSYAFLVLAAETPVCNGNSDGSTTVQCRGKKGGAVQLKVTGTVPGDKPGVDWHKGDEATKLNSDNTKYKITGSKNIELEILNLAETDEGKYEAKEIPQPEKFEVQVVDCLGKTSEPALCQGKPGGSIELGLSDGTVSPLAWKKGTVKITINATKYDGPVTEAILKILNLNDEDEADFTGGTNGDGEKFSVQVADCFGATGTVQCPGKLGEKLKLRISGSVTGADKVIWTKEGGELPSSSKKVGDKNEGLKLKDLKAADAGTYKATYDTSNTVLFVVSVPGEFDVARQSTHCYESRKALIDPKTFCISLAVETNQ